MKSKIEIQKGDITKLKVDAIVNAAHPEENAKVDYGINAGTVVFWMDSGPSNFDDANIAVQPMF